jgi:hypothetical protein
MNEEKVFRCMEDIRKEYFPNKTLAELLVHELTDEQLIEELERRKNKLDHKSIETSK